ncbi:ABC-type transport auxiliary lipoprotein family protein [Pseudoxanthomonas mexicana]|uniref:ABC-type transport auxiliary lipoprotein family protein n=1 Tax=Pseudoxanthomonas mexicana TaxID=128785 RepID=UPI00398A9B1F
MNASKILLPLSLLALAGCSLLGSGQRDPVTLYSPQVRVPADPAWPTVDWSLVVAKPNATRVVDSPRIAVRPVPGELQVYQGAAWAQPSTDLVLDAILRALEDSGRIHAVASSEAGIRADYRLVTDIRRFEADYDGGAQPSVVIEINAKLVHYRDQRVVASRTFLRSDAVGGTDVARVAATFERTLAAITGDIAGWTLASGQQDRPAPPIAPPRRGG